MLRSLSIVPRLVSTLVAGGLLVGVSAFYIVHQYISDGFETAEQRELQALHRNVLSEIDALGNQALTASALIAGMPSVQQAMATRPISSSTVPIQITLPRR